MLIDGGVCAHGPRTRRYERLGASDEFSSFAMKVAEYSYLPHHEGNGRPVVIPERADYPGWTKMPETPWQGSYAGAPIYVAGQVNRLMNADQWIPGFSRPDRF